MRIIETLAMKGLFCSHLDRKEEAHENIKKGLRLDIKSPVCWHVYGLLHRGEKNYEEAIKCYTQSLRIDKANGQILKDLSILHIQRRHYEAFNETCGKILESRPQLKANWLSFAISYQLVGNPEAAERVLKECEYTFKDVPPVVGQLVAYEESELCLYWNSLIEECGDLDRALQHLDEVKPRVKDILSLKESYGRILLKLERGNEAEAYYQDLISMNPDHAGYLSGLEKAKGFNDVLTEADRENILQLYADLAVKYPHSHLIQRRPLDYAVGETFEVLADHHLISLFRKCLPSLFNSYKSLLRIEEKGKIVQRLVESYYENLVSYGTFRQGEDVKEYPSSLLWVAYFLAQLYDFMGDFEKALEYIDIAINHSPTAVELYMAKARFYKHVGDFNTAMNVLEEGRQLDLQDRFVNSKCTKYMLRNNQLATASSTIGLFAKDSSSVDANADLTELQCIWYAFGAAKAHQRLHQFGLALKRFHEIDKHFNDFIDDQLDFHGYAVRKQTFRSYVDLLHTFEVLRNHPYYVRAAKAAVETYLTLFEAGEAAQVLIEGVSLIGLSEGERKKAIKKAKKAELKAKEQKELAIDAKPKTGVATPSDSVSDEDIFGTKFVVGVDHLSEANKFLSQLRKYCENDIDVQRLACRVYMGQTLYRAFRINKETDWIHLFVALLSKVAEDSAVDPAVVAAIKTSLPELCGHEGTLESSLSINESYLKSDNASQIILGLRVNLGIERDASLPTSLIEMDDKSLATFDLKVWLSMFLIFLECCRIV
ncbi:hypothetical protein HDV02_000969 [Globomyces sp. JEL0801]|nr:hypothetical protein HDV02_000969 [Globomyces sp. JEL0801]